MGRQVSEQMKSKLKTKVQNTKLQPKASERVGAGKRQELQKLHKCTNQRYSYNAGRNTKEGLNRIETHDRQNRQTDREKGVRQRHK